MNKGTVIIISGPSGSGKGTVVKQLDKSKYALSVSMTTRSPREGEVDGKDYFFVTRDEFIEIRQNKGFMEHAEFCGNMYGTPVAYVQEQINKGMTVILEIEVYGAIQIKEKFPEAVLIFLVPPSFEELRNRLQGRGTEDQETIERRLHRATHEIEYAKDYDYLVVNDAVENAIQSINSIDKAEKLKAKRSTKFIESFKGE